MSDERGVLPLNDGRSVPYRPIEPGDAPSLQRFHSQLSERSIYQRHFAYLPVLTDDRAHYYTNLDGQDRFALVALDPDAPAEIAAVVRFDREPGTTKAEYAALVLDRWQGKGIGYRLSQLLAEAAIARGITALYAIVLPGNHAMLTLLRDLGYAHHRRFEDETELIELDLTRPD